MRKRFAAALLGLSPFVGVSAHAQTGPSPSFLGIFTALPGANWTGFYLGGDAGGIWRKDVVSPTTPDGGLFPRSNRLSPHSVFGGGTIGYNWQVNDFLLLGIEGDIGDIGGGSSKIDRGTGSEIDYLASGVYGDVTGRLGVAYKRALFYLKGGWAAYGGTGTTTTGVAGFVSSSSPAFTAGWTAGGGAEYKLTPSWSVKVEYLHFDFGTQNATITGVPPTGAGVFPFANKLTADSVKFGINYQFGAPPSPPPATPVAAAPPAPPPAAMTAAKQMFIVFFEFDKSSLTPDGKKVVDAAAAAFKAGKSDIAVAGYTDLAGSQQYNLALSHRRADTVKAALVKDGVAASAIGESWYGKQNPRVPTADGVREPQNRRVEITM